MPARPGPAGPVAAPARGAGQGLTAAEFVWRHTALAAPPLIPEISLYLSDAEPTGLWEQAERATGDAELAPPFWAYPWAGGIALARYLLDHPGQVAGRVVLDLASGSGLVAIAAALAGAARVIASDIDPMALAAIALNAAANGVAIEASGTDLLTADQDAAAVLADRPGAPAPDLVVVGDACYERRLAHRMLAFLARARAGGARTLLGDPGRAYLPGAGLDALASYAVPAWPGLEDTEVKQATVWSVS